MDLETDMVGQVAPASSMEIGILLQHLHRLVINGPRDPEIASAMSAYGYDAVKWAEGQGVLAELVSSERVGGSVFTKAAIWYEEAADVAQRALDAQPGLLAKLGMAWKA